MSKRTRAGAPAIPVAGLLSMAMLLTGPAAAHAASAPADAPAGAPTPATTPAPVIKARFEGLRLLGAPLHVEGSVSPVPGSARILVDAGGGRRALGLRADGSFRARVTAPRAGRSCVSLSVEADDGQQGVDRRLCTTVRAPTRALGSRGASVRYLEERLARRHYALARVDAAFREDTRDAVLAFQKAEGLERDGVVTERVWRALTRARTPRARWGGTYIEIDKRRQLLFEVRNGRVRYASHTSTGATGNTPVGRWRIYRKDPGYNAIGMYYSMYFLRGFATHGYASVPTYPASHGCARLPIWYAPQMYRRWPVGSVVRVHAGSRARGAAAARP